MKRYALILLTALICIVALAGGCSMAEAPFIQGTVSITQTPTEQLNVKASLEDEYGFEAEFTPFNELRIAPTYKLCGAVFTGTTVDNNFVSTNVSGAGTVTQTGGQLLVQTGGINGWAEAYTSRRARFIAGESNMAKFVIQLGDTGLADNARRWGVGNVSNGTVVDGAYFMIDGTTFNIATMKSSVQTLVSSGAFNGDVSTYTLDTDVHIYEVYYTPYTVYFTVDGLLLHTVDASASTWTSTMHMQGFMDNRNSNGLGTNLILYCRAFSVNRFGVLEAAPIYKHISTATTTVCKYGAGKLHAIVMNNPTNNIVTIYDNTSAAGTVVAIINPGASATPFQLNYDVEFHTGLTIVTAGTPDLTVIYE